MLLNAHHGIKSICQHLNTGVGAPALNREREGLAPGRNLLLELVDPGNLARSNLGLEVLELVGLLGQSSLDVLANLDALVNVFGDALEVLDTKATAGHGRGTDTDTARGKSALVARNAVLVAGDVDLLKDSLNTSTIQGVGTQVNQDHVGVGAVRDELVAKLLEAVLQRLGVVDNLLLVGLELGRGCLLEGDSQSSDGVVVGTTLVTGEDREVDGLLEVVHGLLASLGVDGTNTPAEEDHRATRTTERLVGSGSNNIGVEERRGDHTRSDEARNVSNVDDQVSANEISDLAHPRVIDQAAVGRGTGHQNLGPVQDHVLLELVVVNDASLKVNTVGHGLEVGRNSRNPRFTC